MISNVFGSATQTGFGSSGTPGTGGTSAVRKAVTGSAKQAPANDPNPPTHSVAGTAQDTSSGAGQGKVVKPTASAAAKGGALPGATPTAGTLPPDASWPFTGIDQDLSS